VSKVLTQAPEVIEPIAAPRADEPGPVANEVSAVGRPLGVHRISVLVLILGLVLTTALSISARVVHDHNEQRLLAQRVHETATVTGAAASNVQTPLASAAVLAEQTGADAGGFREVMRPIITAKRPFISASIWPARGDDTRPLVVVGKRPQLLERAPSERRRLFDAALGNPAMAVKDLLALPDRRLGYAVAAASPDARYVIYGEGALPRNRRARVASDSAFTNLDYALYLGTAANPANLLASSRPGGRLPGARRGSETVPFGQSKLLVVLAPRGELGGSLLARLPSLLALFGALLSVGAALLVERLARRREAAERLAALLGDAADQNARLYADQREIAQTLQHSLLPERLPGVPGVVAVGRYEAGVSGLEVGGDWYDVLPVGPHRLLFSVGDVCGRGLPAAAAMAALRFSIRAYAVEGNTPAQILDKLDHLVLVARPDQFATVACGVIDTERRELTMASAGHLDFLLLDTSGARFVETPVGTPLGIASPRSYAAKTIALPSSGTILGFTDGLVERRGESLDVGLQRLQSLTPSNAEPLDALVSRLVDDLAPDGSEDDISLLGVRWSFDPVPAGAMETASTGGAE